MIQSISISDLNNKIRFSIQIHFFIRTSLDFLKIQIQIFGSESIFYKRNLNWIFSNICLKARHDRIWQNYGRGQLNRIWTWDRLRWLLVVVDSPEFWSRRTWLHSAEFWLGSSPSNRTNFGRGKLSRIFSNFGQALHDKIWLHMTEFWPGTTWPNTTKFRLGLTR